MLRLSDFAHDPPIFITVRTRTREGAISSDSNVARVPRGISVNTALATISQSAPISRTDFANQMNEQSYGVFGVSRSLGTGSAGGLLQLAQSNISGQLQTSGNSDFPVATLPSSAPSLTVHPGVPLSSTQGKRFSSKLLLFFPFVTE